MRTSKNKRKKTKIYLLYILIVVLILAGSYVTIILLKPLKPIYPTLLPTPSLSSGKLVVNWPTNAQSSIGVYGYGLVSTNGTQTATPTASIAKLVTALLILKKYPLALGEQGPNITLTANDVADYNNFVAEQGSVVRVVAGEKITEYQAIQAMLLPSANNMADTLAVWAYGSIPNYISYANPYVNSLGMDSTVISDASGFSPKTVSTSNDLIKLGQASLSNPVISQIVGQKSAILPVVGSVNNVDYFLGQDSLIGIKTGNTDQAGGCFLSAAKYIVDGNAITVIGAVMKAPNLQSALSETMPMLSSVQKQIQTKTIRSGTVISSYSMPWQVNVEGVTKTTISNAYLPGMNFSLAIHTTEINVPASVNTNVGSISIGLGKANQTSSLVSNKVITKPTIIWRLTHPKYIL